MSREPLSFGRHDMLLNPPRKLLAGELATRHVENNHLLFIDRSGEFVAVQEKYRFKGGMAGSFIAVEEWVILNEKESQRGGLLHHRGIKILISE